jgi:hypothetical protein
MKIYENFNKFNDICHEKNSTNIQLTNAFQEHIMFTCVKKIQRIFNLQTHSKNTLCSHVLLSLFGTSVKSELIHCIEITLSGRYISPILGQNNLIKKLMDRGWWRLFPNLIFSTISFFIKTKHKITQTSCHPSSLSLLLSPTTFLYFWS